MPDAQRQDYKLRYPITQGGETKQAGETVSLRPDQLERIKAYEVEMAAKSSAQQEG